jgi:hypothetical protein
MPSAAVFRGSTWGSILDLKTAHNVDYMASVWHSIYSFEISKIQSDCLCSCGGYYHKLPAHRQNSLKTTTFEHVGACPRNSEYVDIGYYKYAPGR